MRFAEFEVTKPTIDIGSFLNCTIYFQMVAIQPHEISLYGVIIWKRV